MVFLILGCLIQASIFSSIFKKWGTNQYSKLGGVKYGVLIGVFIGYSNELINYATTNILDLTGALVNGVIYLIFNAIGFLTGLVYVKTK